MASREFNHNNPQLLRKNHNHMPRYRKILKKRKKVSKTRERHQRKESLMRQNQRVKQLKKVDF